MAARGSAGFQPALLIGREIAHNPPSMFRVHEGEEESEGMKRARSHAEYYPVPVAILPEQFDVLWHRRAVSRPEHALLLAVVGQALLDLQRFRHARQSRRRRLYADAYRWVMSRDRSHPFSFVNMCETLNLSPDALRAAACRGGFRAAA
jgi:hypothetical protein